MYRVSKLTWVALLLVPLVTSLAIWMFADISILTKLIATAALVAASVVYKFGRAVYKELETKWATRAAEKADRWLSSSVSGFRKAYLDYLRSIHHDVDLRGLVTTGNYILSVEQVFVDLSLAAQPLHLASTGIVRAPSRRKRSGDARQSFAERHAAIDRAVAPCHRRRAAVDGRGVRASAGNRPDDGRPPR